MAYKEFGVTIAPSNVSSTGFPIAMGTHIGGGRIVNDKSTLNSKHWCLLGEGATLNDQKANAIGQIWYDTLDGKYWKLDSWPSTNPVWVDVSTIFATRNYVDTAIDNIPDPMIFKGSLGTGGTITSLPTASSSNTGFTYKVITAGTYAGQVAKIGDTFISDGTTWNLIPSGDEPSGTVTSITLNATSPILIDDSNAITTSGTRTFSHDNSSGNKHIPSGGSTNQILRWTADGTAVWSNEVNTHYTSKNIVSSSPTGITNTNTTNPYLNHIEESTVTSSHRINGSGATTVSSDVGGNITINSTNTTYSFATGTTNGTFNVTPSGGSATAISIYGLGSAAYTSLANYASSSHNHSVFTTTENGFVPKSVTSNTTDFLRRDGTWATPSGTTYTLPLASNGTRGGIQIGYTATVDNNLPLLLSSEKGYVTLTSTSITTGLGYTPYNSTNPNGYTSNTGTVTNIASSETVKHGMQNKTAWDNVIDTDKIMSIANRILRKNGKMVLFAQQPFTTELISKQIANVPFNYCMIWKKDHFANSLIAKKAPLNYYEDILVFTKEYDIENLHPLRDYASDVMTFIGLKLKQINVKLGHRKAEHFFYLKSTQFEICTEQVYNELIEVYEEKYGIE